MDGPTFRASDHPQVLGLCRCLGTDVPSQLKDTLASTGPSARLQVEVSVCSTEDTAQGTAAQRILLVRDLFLFYRCPESTDPEKGHIDLNGSRNADAQLSNGTVRNRRCGVMHPLPALLAHLFIFESRRVSVRVQALRITASLLRRSRLVLPTMSSATAANDGRLWAGCVFVAPRFARELLLLAMLKATMTAVISPIEDRRNHHIGRSTVIPGFLNGSLPRNRPYRP